MFPLAHSDGHLAPAIPPSVPSLHTWWRISLWGQIDHCPSWDGAWLTLLCRARKHASPAFDWTPYVPDMYSFARASVHTPVSMGDAGAAPLPGLRQVASQFQAISPAASQTFGATLAKVGKLLVFLLGKGGPAKVVRLSDVAIVPPTGVAVGEGDMERSVSPAALHLLSLFRGLRTYFHPSNGGRWSAEMAILMNCVLHNMDVRVGAEGALRKAGRSPPGGELTRDDTGLVVEALLPLALEMVYSKIGGIGTIANYCLANLAALSPKSVAPACAELILRALDPVASVNHPHQVGVRRPLRVIDSTKRKSLCYLEVICVLCSVVLGTCGAVLVWREVFGCSCNAGCWVSLLWSLTRS